MQTSLVGLELFVADALADRILSDKLGYHKYAKQNTNVKGKRKSIKNAPIPPHRYAILLFTNI